jgi:ATP-binding cassette subfamily F protein uup
VVKGVTGRRKRNMGRLRALQDLRRERREMRRQTGTVTMTATETELAAKRAIEVRNVTKAYGGRAVVAPTSLRVMRGDRVGIVGPNGAGKTTLLNILTGRLAPDSGTVKLAQNLEIATLDQGRRALSDTETVEHALTGGGGDHVEIDGKPRHVIGYMKDFLFLPEQRFTPVGALSGGERARLLLARVLARPSNLLVLDEPTNDLDLETLDILQEMLGEYSGTVLVVSHDRDFLDRVATQIVAADGADSGATPGADGDADRTGMTWRAYAGGYTDMLAQRGAPPAPAPGPDPAAGRNRTGKARADASPSEKPKPKGPAKAKLSFKDKHALETLPKTIADLEARIARLEQALADPDLYTRDPAAFQKVTDDLTTAQTDLSAAEDDWLRVEMLREEIEGS